MKISTAQETKEWFSTLFEKPYNVELFKDSPFEKEAPELEADRQKKHKFLLQFADLGEMEWYDDPSLMRDFGLRILNSISLSDGNQLHAVGRNNQILGFLTNKVLGIKK